MPLPISTSLGNLFCFDSIQPLAHSKLLRFGSDVSLGSDVLNAKQSVSKNHTCFGHLAEMAAFCWPVCCEVVHLGSNWQQRATSIFMCTRLGLPKLRTAPTSSGRLRSCRARCGTRLRRPRAGAGVREADRPRRWPPPPLLLVPGLCRLPHCRRGAPLGFQPPFMHLRNLSSPPTSTARKSPRRPPSPRLRPCRPATTPPCAC